MFRLLGNDDHHRFAARREKPPAPFSGEEWLPSFDANTGQSARNGRFESLVIIVLAGGGASFLEDLLEYSSLRLALRVT